MKGVVFDGKKAEVVGDLGVRDPRPTEVAVEIRAAGLCHSDVSVMNGTIQSPVPVVMGHEGAGVIVGVGSAVRTVKEGDHVVISTVANCGVCPACSAGYPTRCYQSLGKTSRPFTVNGEPAFNFAASSTFVERTVVAENQAVKIDDDVPFTSACIVGCAVMTGIGAVLNRARLAAGETAAVFGVGGVGLNVIQGCRLSGAEKIIAVDTVSSKESTAMEMGATHFVDASRGDTEEAIRAITGGMKLGPLAFGGIDWSFECVGHPAVLRTAIEVLDWGGNCVAVGIPPAGTELAVDIRHLAYVDRGILGCRYGQARPHRDIPLYVRLYKEGRLKLDELVSARYPIGDFHQAVDDLHSGSLAKGVFTF